MNLLPVLLLLIPKRKTQEYDHQAAYTILRNETKRNETKRNETKSGEIEQN